MLRAMPGLHASADALRPRPSPTRPADAPALPASLRLLARRVAGHRARHHALQDARHPEHVVRHVEAPFAWESACCGRADAPQVHAEIFGSVGWNAERSQIAAAQAAELVRPTSRHAIM